MRKGLWARRFGASALQGRHGRGCPLSKDLPRLSCRSAPRRSPRMVRGDRFGPAMCGNERGGGARLSPRTPAGTQETSNEASGWSTPTLMTHAVGSPGQDRLSDPTRSGQAVGRAPGSRWPMSVVENGSPDRIRDHDRIRKEPRGQVITAPKHSDEPHDAAGLGQTDPGQEPVRPWIAMKPRSCRPPPPANPVLVARARTGKITAG